MENTNSNQPQTSGQNQENRGQNENLQKDQQQDINQDQQGQPAENQQNKGQNETLGQDQNAQRQQQGIDDDTERSSNPDSDVQDPNREDEAEIDESGRTGIPSSPGDKGEDDGQPPYSG